MRFGPASNSPVNSSDRQAPTRVRSRRGFSPAVPPRTTNAQSLTDRSKEMSDGDNILIADMPDLTLLINLFQEMDMGPDQSGWMAAAKRLRGHSFGHIELCVAMVTEMNRSSGQFLQNHQSGLELLTLLADGDLRISSQWVGVDCCHKIAAGIAWGAGTLLNGRVRRAVHRPDPSNPDSTSSRLNQDRLAAEV